jgi:hypothetical protein
MITITTRTMTPEERHDVEQTVEGVRGVYSGCVYFFIQLAGGTVLGMFAFAIPGALLHWLGAPETVMQVLFVLCSFGGFWLGVRSIRKDRREGTQRHLLDLAESTVQEIHCTVLDAVQVEPFEDEGAGFFLDVGDGKLLYVRRGSDEVYEELNELDEDELDPPEGERRFPCRELRITRTPHGSLILRMEHLGEPFEPSRVRESLDGQVEYVPEDGEILTGSLVTLEADLRRLLQASRREN